MVRTLAGAYYFPSLLYKEPITVATIVFRLILAKFRPNSDQKNTEIQTKFRPILTIFNRNSDLP